MRLSDVHCRWKIRLRIGALVVAVLPVCASAYAQAENSGANSNTAGANSLYSQGMLALQRRDLSGARVAFEKTVQLVPRSPEPHNSLGWVLMAQGETDAAIAEFKIAVRLKPDFAQAHMNLSSALLQKGDQQGAVRESRFAH